MYPIAIVADIEKAFLMIRVMECDQDVLRFLWFKDVNVVNPEMQIYKFTRVVFGVGPSPYLLNATIAQHLRLFEGTHLNTVQRVKESIYVDDVVMGANSVHEAFTLYKESKEIFSKGGFNLRKFVSNCHEIQDLIETAEHEGNVTSESYAQFMLSGVTGSLKSEQQKVLGVLWSRDSDELVIDLKPPLSLLNAG